MTAARSTFSQGSSKAKDMVDFQAQLTQRESEIIEDYPKLNNLGQEKKHGLGYDNN